MIPISQPTITEAEIRLVTDAVTSGWVSSLGKYIEQFEREFAEYCGVRHCVSTSNGTVAIHLALKVLGIGAGDEVIVPDLTFVATANAVALAGATPVIADVSASDWCLDPAAVERHMTSRTKAIIPVHLYGHPCDMESLRRLAEPRRIAIIEDAAEAHGAFDGDRRVGGLGDFGTFSFYGNKIVTTGEGGALTTDSDELAERARLLRDHGMSPTRRYWHSEIAYNYRLTNLQAALGVAQMQQIDAWIGERARILDTYRRLLEPRGFTLNPHRGDTRPVNWMTCLLVEGIDRSQRDHLITLLRTKGVDSRPFFYPLSALPMYPCDHANPVSHALSPIGLNLPTFPALTDAEIAIVSDAVSAAVDQIRKTART
jgi:perosamine synthetase